MSPKRNHSIYVSDEAWEMVEEIARQRGITSSAAVEIITRAFFAARFAIEDHIRSQDLDRPEAEAKE